MSGPQQKEMRTVPTKIARRVARTVLMLVVAGGMTSCIDDPPTLPEREGIAAQTNAIRLYMDNQPVMTIYEDGKLTLGPIVFVRTATNVQQERPVRAELLDAQGNVIQNVSPNDVRINFGEESGNWVFTRDDAFSGRLRSTATTLPSTVDFVISLYDMNQRRIAIGPYTVRVLARLP